jgi:uncharacterized protein (TIGR02246 family)
MRNALLMVVLVLMTVTAAFSTEVKQGTVKEIPIPQAEGSRTADEKAVRASAEAFLEAFNKGDSKQIASLLTDDCRYSDETGREFQGREVIEKEYAAFFAAHPGVKMESTISSLKTMGGNAAIEEGTSVLKSPKGEPLSRGTYTAILVKHGEKWLTSGIREYASPSVSARPAFNDLEWLIGDWTASQDAKNVNLTVKWVADKKFIEVSYAAGDKDAVVRSGVQILGRDPLSGDLVSWSFDSGGGHGRGDWKLLKHGWVVKSQGVMADGAPVASTDIVSKIDKDSFSWQSIKRSVAGRALTDSQRVVLKRKSQ